MSAIIFDGRAFAKSGEEKLKSSIKNLDKKGIKPKLVSILVGNNPASVLYVNLKKKAAERVGAEAEVINLNDCVDESELQKLIQKLNNDPTVHGIMVQLPLPISLSPNTKEILNEIALQKDIDGLTDKNTFVPATVKAILEIIENAFISLDITDRVSFVKSLVVVGSSGMVGTPLVKILKTLEYPVIGLDIRTPDLIQITREADILISATGEGGLIKSDMVKDGAIVIDVGSPQGDVDFESVSQKASFITPVPGGVGPVTILSLLDNLIISTGAVSVI